MPEYTPDIEAALRTLARGKSVSTGGAVDADELFSVAETAAALALPSYRPRKGVPLRAYLCLKARYAILDYLRAIDATPRRQRKAGVRGTAVCSLEAQLGNFLDLKGHTVPADRGERADSVRHVLALLEQLPARPASVLRWRYLDEEKLAEIGCRLGVSEARAQQLVVSSLAQLRRLWEKSERA